MSYKLYKPHDKIVKRLAFELNAFENHSTMRYDFDGRFPDLVVFKDFDAVEIHEVEMVKDKSYSNLAPQRVLWLVVSGKWESIRVLNYPKIQEERLSELLDLEATLRQSIHDLKGQEEHLIKRVEEKRKEFLDLFKKKVT